VSWTAEQHFDSPTCEGGFFLGASLLDHVAPGMAAYDEEIFGPGALVARVDTYDEGLRLINANPYGNGTAIFTETVVRPASFQFDVEVGMVGVNVPVPVPVAYYSFGGWKDLSSAMPTCTGRRHRLLHPHQGGDSRWPDPATSAIDLGFPRTR